MLSRNLKNSIINAVGESFWGFQASMVASATLLVIVLRHFRAGTVMIGSISSIETFTFLVPQIFGLYLFTTRANRKLQLIFYHLVAMIPFLFAIGFLLHFSSRFSPEFVRVSILACWGLFTCSIGVIAAVWMDWLAGVFDINCRGTAMGIAFCASSVLGVVGSFTAAWTLGHLPAVLGYSSLYFFAGALAVLSIVIFVFIDDPGSMLTNAASPTVSSLFATFHESLVDSDFRAFLVGRILTASGFCILPLIGNYFCSPNGGGLSASELMLCGAAMAVGSALAQIALGRIGDKHGHRIGLIAGAVAQVCALLSLLLIRGELGCFVVYLSEGIYQGSSSVSVNNMVIETCPHAHRSAHITLANLIIGGFTIFLPLAAGAAASSFGNRPVFAVSLAVSVLAVIWLYKKVRDPRDKMDDADIGGTSKAVTVQS